MKMPSNSAVVDLHLLDGVLGEYAKKPGSLITILQKAQDIYGYLPREALEEISAATGIPPAKVLGVASFYTQFRFEPAGKHLIMLCQGTACHVNGSLRIERAILEELGISDLQTTSDGLFSLKNVACLGCCSLSPVMMIDGDTYGSLTPDETKKIIKRLREASM